MAEELNPTNTGDQQEAVLTTDAVQQSSQTAPTPMNTRQTSVGDLFRSINRRDVLTLVILLVLVVVGYNMRAVGRNWDDYTQLHPDERFLSDMTSTVRSGPVMNPAARTDMSISEHFQMCYGVNSQLEFDNLSTPQRFQAREDLGRGGYFDARCSELNVNVARPTIFVYGQFPLFSTRVLAETQADLTDNSIWSNYINIRLVGRTMNSVFDTLVIVLVFLIGARLLGRWQGLLAATFYTFAAFPIQQSHFWTADAFTNFWVVLTIYFAVRILDRASDVRERYALLPWIGTSLALWLYNASLLDDANKDLHIESIALMLGTSIVVGLWNTVTAERDMPFAGFAGTTVGALALAGHRLLLGEQLMLEAVIAAVITMAALSALWQIGYYKFAGYTGTWPWLAAAYGLWIYDTLANYGYDESFIFKPPQVELLAAYLLFFTASALLASGLRYGGFRNPVNLFLAIGVPFFVMWGAVALTVLSTISLWGALAAIVLALFIGVSSYYGLRDEVGFGLAFGAALAGRVNVAPLVGLIFLVLIIRALLLTNWRVYRFERNLRFTRLTLGLVLAGIATIVVFRFLQPHAFTGPSVIGIVPNVGWVDDIAEARYLTSGKADIPPNYQWTNRVPWLYPLQNIVFYGLGLPLGIAAWGGLLWALVRIARGKQNWTRLAVPAAWIVVYFGWLGQNWVTTMRYFLPIYAALTLFAAWALIEFGGVVWRIWQQRPQALPRRVALGATTAAALLVVGHTLAYGYGFTSIHRNQLTRVQAAQYAQEFIPGDVGLFIEHDSGRERMVNLAVYTFGQRPNIQTLNDGDTLRHPVQASFAANVQSVAIHFMSDPLQDADIERVRVSVWSSDNLSDDRLLGAQLLEVDLSSDQPFGAEQFITFDPPVPVYVDASGISTFTYHIEVEVLEGGPVSIASGVQDPLAPITPAHMTVFYNDQFNEQLAESQVIVFEQDESFSDVSYLAAGSVHEFTFEAHTTGVIREMVIPHLSDPFNDASPETLQITLSNGFNSVTGSVTGDFNTADDGHLLFGPETWVQLDEPYPVVSGQRYTLYLEPQDFIGIAGAAVAWEGQWDDPMPAVVCPLPNDTFYEDVQPSGMCTLETSGVNLYQFHYIGLTQNMHWPDEPEKREDTLNVLNQTDYIFIGSNRFYDSFNRNPSRWPMSNDYYEALFNGELGFELVETFTSYAKLGPLEWPDQTLPTDGLFNWRNEFEAEEAFHVYDHPAVFLLRKTADYSPARAADILGVNIRAVEDITPFAWWQTPGSPPDDVPVNRHRWDSLTASESPVALQFTDTERDTQREGGTWSDMFSYDSMLNNNQGLGAGVWWLMMLAVGWFTFPLLHWILPGLPDRGFAIGKLVGWLIVAWVAWMGASLRFEIWTQGWLWLLMGGFAALNAVLAFWRRHALLTFIRQRWQHLLFLEVLATVLFLVFIGVRLGNPDLWHDFFGGEKPMNVAYFNAVLRSSIFPPVDPWFAGGYINYYYWGYVLVGAPTKMLGIVPQFAYNLILPTLFSMTGMGAFSVAYNLVQSIRDRRREVAEATDTTPAPRWRETLGPVANPYFAGIATLVLAVVLGNLGTVREFSRGLSTAGGWTNAAEYEAAAYRDEYTEFLTINQRDPTLAEQEALREEVQLSNLEATQKWVTAIWDGLVAVSTGEQALAVPAHRWYWGPSRVIAELSDNRGNMAITEMPYFTFLYGDLHAHMMSMPLQLLVILILTSELLGAGRRQRGFVPALLALLLLGATVGLLRPTNTWDWPTYMVLGVVGLTFAAWIGQGRLRGDEPPSPLFARLREYLDLRMALRLWPLLALFPVGMGLYLGLYVVQDSDYDSKLRRGQVPIECQNAEPGSPFIPDYCDGLLEPHFSLGSMMVWGGAAIGAAAILYMAGLIVLGNRFNRDALLLWVARIMTFGLASAVAIAPYMSRFATAYGKILPWEAAKTPQWTYMTVHGVFFFILVSFLLWQTLRWLRQYKVSDLRGLGVPVIAIAAAIPTILLITFILGVLGEYRVFISALPLLGWVVILYLLPGQSNVMRWLYVLIGLAVGLTMAVEVVVLEGDNGRQNMVFKFYMQAWLMFSIASGVALAFLFRSIERWRPSLSGVWQMSLAILLTLALLFPITATQGRWQDRMNADATPLTLDGMEFMRYASRVESSVAGNFVLFNLRGDYEMIRWLQENVEGTPTIIETQGREYTWNSRIAIHTGLPTILGWQHHQMQQRNLQNFDRLVVNRVNNVKAFYDTTDIEVAMNLIDFYDIEYIILGTYERVYYDDILAPDALAPDPTALQFNQNPGLEKFDQMVELGLLEAVFVNEVCVSGDIFEAEDCPTDRLSTDVIYRVVPGAAFDSNAVIQATD